MSIYQMKVNSFILKKRQELDNIQQKLLQMKTSAFVKYFGPIKQLVFY